MFNNIPKLYKMKKKRGRNCVNFSTTQVFSSSYTKANSPPSSYTLSIFFLSLKIHIFMFNIIPKVYKMERKKENNGMHPPPRSFLSDTKRCSPPSLHTLSVFFPPPPKKHIFMYNSGPELYKIASRRKRKKVKSPHNVFFLL